VQWMTAASGILHKEYHEEEFSKKGGAFQMVQLWVNLPSQDKKSKPKYQAITRSEMGKYELPNDSGTVEVIAGDYNGAKGPATTFTPIHMFNVRLKKGGDATLNLPENFNTGILVIEGSVKVNGNETAPQDHFILFKNDGETISLHAEEDAVLLVLSGQPIDEPIVAYGPFVMNTYDEIQEAMDDFRMGKYGVLED